MKKTVKEKMSVRNKAFLTVFVIIFLLLAILCLPLVLTPSSVKNMMQSIEAMDEPEGRVLHDIVYKNRFLQSDLELDVYYPFHDAGPAPVLVFFHGGSWLHGDKSMIRIIDPFLNEVRRNGIAVVAINYTSDLAGGLKAPVENCRDSLHWLRDHGSEYGLNPLSLGLYGVSAGAHLALMSVPGIIDDPLLDLRFIMEEFGPVDLQAMAGGDAFGSSKIFRFFSTSALEKYSPLVYVTSDWPPVLILHGTSDNTVAIHQSELLANRLKEKGVPHTFKKVPRGDHGFFNKPQSYWRELEKISLSFFLPLMFPEQPHHSP